MASCASQSWECLIWRPLSVLVAVRSCCCAPLQMTSCIPHATILSGDGSRYFSRQAHWEIWSLAGPLTPQMPPTWCTPSRAAGWATTLYRPRSPSATLSRFWPPLMPPTMRHRPLGSTRCTRILASSKTAVLSWRSGHGQHTWERWRISAGWTHVAAVSPAPVTCCVTRLAPPRRQARRCTRSCRRELHAAAAVARGGTAINDIGLFVALGWPLSLQ